MTKIAVGPNRSMGVLAFLVLNFLFFAHVSQASPSPSWNSATAALFQTDSATEGSWTGVYGNDGYAIDSHGQSLPSYAQFSVANALDWTWDPDTTDPRALQTGSARLASAWYSPSSFTINVAFTDGATHQIALYLLDWDAQGRSETVQIFNARTNALLSTQAVANFTQGQYLVFNVSGRVTINVSAITGPNAVVSGVFFAPSASAQSSSSTSTTTALSSSPSLTALLSASVSTLNFGSVGISQISTQAATFINSGATNVTISNVNISGAGFSVSGLPVGTVLTPGQSVSVTVTFIPASSGTSTGTLVITSDAGSNTIALTGTGAATSASQQYSVNLVWNASTSSDVIGYNTYYSSVSGGPYSKLNPTALPSTAYTDATVTPGMTRYYVVTSVDSSNVESGYSSEVSVNVP